MNAIILRLQKVGVLSLKLNIVTEEHRRFVRRDKILVVVMAAGCRVVTVDLRDSTGTMSSRLSRPLS